MKKKLLWLILFLFLIIIGINFYNIFFGLNPVELLLGNGEECGGAFLHDYGSCENGYYCKPPDIHDSPGSCIKVVRWIPYMLYDGRSIYYSDIDLTVSVANYARKGSYSDWDIEFKKGNEIQNEKLILEDHGELTVNTFGYKINFKDVDGVNSRSVKATIVLF